MQEQQRGHNGNFFDPKTLIAIVLVGFVWIGWQTYLQKKYPEAYKKKSAPPAQTQTAPGETDAAQTPAAAANDGASGKPAKETPSAEASDRPFEERIVVHEDDTWRLEFSSKGMGLKGIYLKTYRDRQGEYISLGGAEGYLPFETNLMGRQMPLEFQVEKTGENTIVGTASKDGREIRKTIQFDPERYSFKVDIVVSGAGGDFAGLVNFLNKKLVEVESSFFMPAMNQQELFVSHAATTSREYLTIDQPYRGAFAQAHIAALGEHYFSLAMVDHSDVIPELDVAVDTATRVALAKMSYPVINRASEYKISYIGFAGPKDTDILKSIDPRMTDLVDFGWFSWLAIILFDILRWLNSVVGNWGVAIILLTILVRIFVLPFHMMSYKSMKAMQTIQPQIKALREKYKDDQQTLNREMMAFMKEHKVNPMGGCLPMLLQFPVFIALYRVFGQSIDLYQAPFAFWIQDLSLKDPYYVLPVVMGVVFFFQTKITPSTMDPAQQKVMMIMPVMFSFFMAGLPSALTLYMCVSTIFGFIQQLYVMRDNNKNNQATASVTQAKA